MFLKDEPTTGFRSSIARPNVCEVYMGFIRTGDCDLAAARLYRIPPPPRSETCRAAARARQRGIPVAVQTPKQAQPQRATHISPGVAVCPPFSMCLVKVSGSLRSSPVRGSKVRARAGCCIPTRTNIYSELRGAGFSSTCV